MNNYVESGSLPAQLYGGTTDVRFEYDRNSLGTITHYSIDGRLSDDHQLVSGTLSYWVRRDGVTTDVTEGCEFTLRRNLWDPAYVNTTPGDFSCASEQRFAPAYGTFSNGNEPRLSPTTAVPRPSCFDAPLTAMRLVPSESGSFTLESRVGGGTQGQMNDRPVAIFSACDGVELACVAAQPEEPGYPTLEVELERFRDVILVTDSTDDVAFRIWMNVD